MRYFCWVDVGESIPGLPWQPWVVEIKMDFATQNALREGAKLRQRPEYFVGVGDSGTPIDYPFSIPLVPVASSRLQGLLQDSASQCLELIPLRLTDPAGRPRPEGYAVVNYLKAVDCLDRERSEYVVFTKENLTGWQQRPQVLGMFRDIRRLVIDPSKLEGYPIFRLWGWSTVIIVREDLKSQIETSQMSGCEFVELEVRN